MNTEYAIGDYLVTVVDDHIGAPREKEVVFPDVASKDWEPYRDIALNRKGEFQSQWRGHLVRRSDGTGPMILVDTGMGPGPHAHTGENGELLGNLGKLGKLGISARDIDSVVTTHCHGDHIGWNITYEGKNAQLTFPSAKYHIAANDWEHYSKPENTNEAFDRNVAPLERMGALHLVKGELELAPGVTTLPTNGHTPGHQCVKIESGGQVGVITGDLFHSVAQVSEQSWCPTFDWRTDLSTASRKWLMWRAQSEDWTVFSGHLPTGSSIGKIVPGEGEKPAWQPV